MEATFDKYEQRNSTTLTIDVPPQAKIDKLQFAELPAPDSKEADPKNFLYLFVGKLPFKFSPKHILWVLQNAPGSTRSALQRIYGIDIIYQPNRLSGVMQPKGCAYVLVHSRDAVECCSMHHYSTITPWGITARFDSQKKPVQDGDFVVEQAHIPVTSYNIEKIRTINKEM
jgi:hypothetical protein